MTHPTPAVEFLFDYASPFAFLASELLETRLPNARIEYRPIYIRGLEMFAKGVPHVGAKLAYLLLDLRRCAEDAGIELALPATFPVNGLYALRGALAAQRLGCFDAYHTPMFRAVWQSGRDVSKKEVVAELATELGLPEVAAALDDPSLKEALRVATDSASARGVFGVPTFFVGSEMFWGHDRMHQVKKAVVAASAERTSEPRFALEPVTFKGDGLNPDIGESDWAAIRDRIPEGRGR